MASCPNVLFFHVDNLGFGELSCSSGGPFRGTWTRRIAATSRLRFPGLTIGGAR